MPALAIKQGSSPYNPSKPPRPLILASSSFLIIQHSLPRRRPQHLTPASWPAAGECARCSIDQLSTHPNSKKNRSSPRFLVHAARKPCATRVIKRQTLGLVCTALVKISGLGHKIHWIIRLKPLRRCNLSDFDESTLAFLIFYFRYGGKRRVDQRLCKKITRGDGGPKDPPSVKCGRASLSASLGCLCRIRSGPQRAAGEVRAHAGIPLTHKRMRLATGARSLRERRAIARLSRFCDWR